METGSKPTSIQLSKSFNKDSSNSNKEMRSLSPNQPGRKNFSETKLDSYIETESKRTIHSASKTSMEEDLDSFYKTISLHPGTTQTFTEHSHI